MRVLDVHKCINGVTQEKNIARNYFLLSTSALQTNTDAFANSEDPDEKARNEPSHLDLHRFPFCY